MSFMDFVTDFVTVLREIKKYFVIIKQHIKTNMPKLSAAVTVDSLFMLETLAFGEDVPDK